MKAGCDFVVDGGQPRHGPRTAKIRLALVLGVERVAAVRIAGDVAG